MFCRQPVLGRSQTIPLAKKFRSRSALRKAELGEHRETADGRLRKGIPEILGAAANGRMARLDFELGRGRLRHAMSAVRPHLAGDSVKRARQDQRSDHDANPQRRSAHKPSDSRNCGRRRAFPRRTLGPLGSVTRHVLICRLRNVPLRLTRSHRPDTRLRTRRLLSNSAEIESVVASVLLIDGQDGACKAKPWQIGYGLMARRGAI